jgi:alpha-tubulin suppressor-like RCC1 family protein
MPQVWKIVAGRKKGGDAGTPALGQVGAGSDSHSMFIDVNGQAWGWGNNQYYAIGDNTNINRCVPVSVVGTTKTFCQIVGGHYHSSAIDKNGQVWSWGTDSSGNLGIGVVFSPNHPTPKSIAGGQKTFCKISARTDNTSGIDNNGKVWAWGNNSKGQIGDGTTTNRCTPTALAGVAKTFCEISSGNSTTAAIDKNGQIWTWGWNFFGYLGDGTLTDKCTPVSVAGSTKTFCKITSRGQYHMGAIDKNGQVWCWGFGALGQLGTGNTQSSCSPRAVAGATKTFCKIDAGFYHTVAIDKNGQAWSWGYNFSGQLGDNSTTARCTPVSVAGSTKTFCEISTGNEHVIAIDKNGDVWAWGSGASGRLGDNTTTSRLTPVRVCNI